MMIAMIIMIVMVVIFMKMMTKMTNKHTNIMTFQQKCANLRNFYLVKSGMGNSPPPPHTLFRQCPKDFILPMSSLNKYHLHVVAFSVRKFIRLIKQWQCISFVPNLPCWYVYFIFDKKAILIKICMPMDWWYCHIWVSWVDSSLQLRGAGVMGLRW